jgi:DNA replication protein DnaC
MHTIPELIPLLKLLRLSGILDSPEARNREASDRQLAYTDFLSLLVHDEVARRERKKLAQRLRRQTTLECFDFDRLPHLNRAVIHDLAPGRFIEEKVAVLIVGPCGTGKSHLAQAIGHCAARQGHDVLFTTQTQLLNGLRQAQAIDGFARRFQTLVSVPLLIIDDFGLKPLRPP